jgi:hypothetical protein
MISILFRILQAVLSLGVKLDSRATELKARIQDVLDGQQTILDELAQLSDLLVPGPAVSLVFTAFLNDGTILNEVTQMNLQDDQDVLLTISPKDKKGKPSLLDGVPVWAGSDDTVLTVVASADGLSATVSGVAPGAGRVVVTGDADLGAGVVPITGTLDFTITAGATATVDITAGTPTPQA